MKEQGDRERLAEVKDDENPAGEEETVEEPCRAAARAEPKPR